MLQDLLNFRRAVRHYDPDKPIDSAVVRHCLELARLAPSSSNLQLYEFYHITGARTRDAIASLCLGQTAATTAQQLVVFVSRPDLFKRRMPAVYAQEVNNLMKYSTAEEQARVLPQIKSYYQRLLPLLYGYGFGLMGPLRRLIFGPLALFRPMYRQLGNADVRIVAHKSCALAAQTFMLAMAEAGQDTCPMEGLDSGRIKKILGLPRRAEITMVVSCGIRIPEKIRGERQRLPFPEIYRERAD